MIKGKFDPRRTKLEEERKIPKTVPVLIIRKNKYSEKGPSTIIRGRTKLEGIP